MKNKLVRTKAVKALLVKRDKVGLTERALMKRLNRFLADKEISVHKNRPARSLRGPTPLEKELGTFFVVRGDAVVEKHVDLEEFARRHGVLAAWECLGAS